MAISKSALQKRIIKMESTAWLWGTGNPETISYDTMDLMKDDPYIKMALTMIKAPILTGEWVLTGESDELKEFVQTYLIDRFLGRLLTNALYGLDYGFCVQEKVYTKEDGYLVPLQFNAIKPTGVTITVDQDYGFYTGAKVVSIGGSAILPASKTWLYTYNPEFDNYYGETILKPVYRSWYDEQIMTVSYLRHLESRGTPIAILYFPDDLDENDALMYAGTASTIVHELPYRKEIAIPSRIDPDTKQRSWELQMVSNDPRGEGYVDGINLSNKKKLIGMLIPPMLVDREAGTGTYAESYVKLDMALMLIEGIQKSLQDGLNDHVIDQLLKLNFPNADEGVKIEALPLEKAKEQILVEFTKEILRTDPGEDVLALARDYIKEMYSPADDKAAPPQVPDDEK